jgi:DNA-binding transcriptional LysR family regulator
MMYWLIPRLGRFNDANPEVELRFNMSHGPIDFARDSVSVAIRLSSIDPPKNVVRTDVAHEWIGPVCSPEYLRKQRLRSIDDLVRARLMVSRTRPTAWADWAHCSGQDLDLRVDEAFDHFYLLIQGARCGLGMANVPRMLVRDDLTTGTLVAPLDFVHGPNRLSIWIAPHLSRRSDVVKLVDWLHDELRATEP